MKVWGASGLRNLAGQGGILFCCAMAVAILFVLLYQRLRTAVASNREMLTSRG